MPALHNGLTSNPKLVEAYRRALGETSQGFSGLERGSESMQPVMDLWALPEWALLRGEIIFSRTSALGAQGAGVFSTVELVNPATSGVLAVVLAIRNVSGGVAIQPGIDSGAALGAVATNQGVANDARWPNLGAVSQCTIVQGALGAGTALPQDEIPNGTESTHPYIIQPGKKLFISPNAANSANSMALLWTERPLLPGESRV